MRRDFALAVDPVGVHLLDEEPLEPLHERTKFRPVEPGFRERGDEVEAEVPEEDLLQKGGRPPLGLARVLRDLAGIGLGQRSRLWRLWSHRENFT